MTKFILHGGYTSTKNDLNTGFFTEIVKDLSDEDTILLVYFSREDEEYDALAKQDSAAMSECAGEKKINFVIANGENFIQQVNAAQVIYFRGGDTEKLLNTIQQYPEFEDAIQEKVLAGSSAGAYLFATYYHSASRGTIHEGLGILPLRVVCHFESSSGEYNVGKQALQDMEVYPSDLELVVLHDFEWKVFQK